MDEPAAASERPAGLRTTNAGRPAWWDPSWDALLYVAAAAGAAFTAATSLIPLYRTWGRLALVPYAAAAATSLVLALRGGRAGVRARAWIAAGAFLLAGLVPMAAETVARSQGHPALHVQPEVTMVEVAAGAALHGLDPYRVRYLHGPLASQPLATKLYYPYLPAMLLFGLPRAIAGGTSPLTDARVWFMLGTLLVVWAALALWRGPSQRRLRILQVLAVLPTGTLFLATGGDDLPVLALMLLGLVAMRERRVLLAGAALGLAVAIKQTAWPLAPFFLAAAYWRGTSGAGPRAGRRDAALAAAGMAAVALPFLAPFLAWHPAAFIRDTIRFPLNLTPNRSTAATPTLGSALIGALPHARLALTITYAAVILAAAALLFLSLRTAWARARPVAAAARAAGIVLAIAVVLAPAGRIGYAIYPINLLVWAALLEPAAAATPSAPEEGGEPERALIGAG